MILMVIAIIVLLLAVTVAGWMTFQLLQQNGRILLRLDSLEEQLKQRPVPQARQSPQPEQYQGLPVGSLAPEFHLPDLSGSLTSLTAFRGRRVLLVFFNLRCGFCLRMAPALKALTSDISGSRPALVVVATGDPGENAQFFRENGIECPVLLQKEMEVASLFGARGTPMGYLIDGEGKIASELAVGEAALLALVGLPVLESSGNVPLGPPGLQNGHQHPVGKGNRSLADSQINRSGLKAGVAAPSFRLPRVGPGDRDVQETLSLESFRGQRVLLVFSDPNCGPCSELAVELERQWRQNKAVQILMVSRGDATANREKMAEQQLTFPVVLQRQWELSKLYGMFATPIAYLIDEYGAIVHDAAVGVEPILRLLSHAGAESVAVLQAAI